MSAPTTSQKTPVHSAVAVICDILTPLSNEERMRAMEAIAASLGILNPAATSGTRVTQPAPIGLPPIPALPSQIPVIATTALAPVPVVRPVGLATPRSYRGANGSSVAIGAPRGRDARSLAQGDVTRVVVVGSHRRPATSETSYRCR